MSVAQYIVNGLNLEPKPQLQKYIENDLNTACAITGETITQGIHWRHVIPGSTAEYLDLMNGMAMPYLSLSSATAFKGSWNMGSRLIFEDGTMYHPYISAQGAAKSERSYWSKLVRETWSARRGENCLCIITDDYKKKVWPMARIGQLGTNTQVLLYDSKNLRLQNLTVDWQKLINVLEFIEEVYTAGFSKRAISDSLFVNYAGLVENGRRAMDWEKELDSLRRTPEFAVSLLIAQKKLKELIGQL